MAVTEDRMPVQPSMFKTAQGTAVLSRLRPWPSPTTPFDGTSDRIRTWASTRPCLRRAPGVQGVLHDAELAGAESGLGAIADVELGQDIRDVVLDGTFGEIQAIGDFLVRRAAAEQRDDLSLAG